MIENDYIVATNLAKLRIVEEVLRSVFPGEGFGISKDKHKEIVLDIGDMVISLELKV